MDSPKFVIHKNLFTEYIEHTVVASCALLKRPLDIFSINKALGKFITVDYGI